MKTHETRCAYPTVGLRLLYSHVESKPGDFTSRRELREVSFSRAAYFESPKPCAGTASESSSKQEQCDRGRFRCYAFYEHYVEMIL